MLGKDIAKRIAEALLESCKEYFRKNLPDRKFPEIDEVSLQVTRDARHGDLASNVAMRLAAAAGASPVEIGQNVISFLKERMAAEGLDPYVETVEMKGGFMNFRFSVEYYRALLSGIFSLRDDFGRSGDGAGQRVNLEFVSANPTGPLTIAHGRQAAIGDALSRILSFSGYDVTSEYYLNDCGRQIKLLGESVETRYRNHFGEDDAMPEDGYMGVYIINIAEEIKKTAGDARLARTQENSDFFREHAVEYMMGLIRKDLDDFGVSFDTWTSQGKLEGRGEVEKALDTLRKGGNIYEKEGATWFASTRLGDDKDRVVIKNDGAYTYLAPDIAYHLDKYSRGYTKLIDLLGPDHHGYIRRMKAAVQALGHEAGSLDILIVQLVSLIRGGESVSMSTRKGEFVSLRELLDDIGKDVTRFFFLSRRLDSQLEFDVDLAKKESSDNPVFYIQYAHARICSIKRYSRENSISLDPDATDLARLETKEEKQLMRKLGEFPFAVKASAEALEPNRLITYLNELARCFHSFYTECRVVSDDAGLSNARLFLVECVRIMLANGLGLLNITLPEKM